MRTFIWAGLIYLVGVAIVLALKPSSMFREDGAWKEFGIGRNYQTHTWFPFWLFAIFWAVISYILTVQILSVFGPSDVTEVVEGDFTLPKRSRRKGAQTLPKGYYMLNRTATEEAGGIPKYVYLGPELDD